MTWWEECQWHIHERRNRERAREETLRKFSEFAEAARQDMLRNLRSHKPKQRERQQFTPTDIAMLKEMGIAV